MHNEKVFALIDKERAVWKSELVNSIFLPHEASAILAIPLSFILPKDRKVWSGTANGVFSIRSAYHVSHKQLSKTNVRECSNNNRMKSLWKAIWKLHYPKKLKTLFGEHVRISSQLKMSLETARFQWNWSATCVKAWKQRVMCFRVETLQQQSGKWLISKPLALCPTH